MGSVWQRLCALHLRGTWKPGSYNAVLLMAQIVVLWTAAQRGLDYVTAPGRGSGPGPRPSPALIGIEQDIPLEVLGLAFLIPAGVAFFGLATGWAKPLSLGHLFVGAAYLILGITFLRDSPVDSWPLAAAGCALLVAAAVLLVANLRNVPDIIALPFGVLAMIAGGWLASRGLGYGYRTGNGFLGGAALHFTFGFGTQILARRESRLRREEEEDFRALGIQ
jgi:hypothetical protein